MTSEQLRQERTRLDARPIVERPNMLLGKFEVTISVGAHEYGQRIRSALHAALNICIFADFEAAEVLPTERVPGWFSSICGEQEEPTAAPVFALAGAQCYMTERGESAWGLQEWLFSFDSQDRSWRWWDITESAEHSAIIWVDTFGEPVVAYEQLYWTAYACGAQHVSQMQLVPSSEWRAQPSTGIYLSREDGVDDDC